jgi:histidyl-tRNA synthetase
MTRNLAYYTGIVFNIKTNNDLYVLGGGGRYDDLPNRLGYEYQNGCSGFALNLSRITEIIGDSK